MARRVVALVVAYRRPELLQRCVRAVTNQTRRPDVLIVIDNGGEARAALREEPESLEIVEMPTNTGPAGGYHRGFEIALERGAEAIWTVDDDTEPEPSCLDQLLRASTDPCVRIPLQIRGGTRRGFPPSWNGPLFDAEVITAVGLPDHHLFFWGEDTEFFHRIKKSGTRILSVENAVINHSKPDVHVRGKTRDWRTYYQVRNSVYLRLRVLPLSLRGMKRLAVVIIGKPAAIILFESHKWRSLRLYWSGIYDGLRGRLGKTVDPEKWG